jgi:hypothetical protein
MGDTAVRPRRPGNAKPKTLTRKPDLRQVVEVLQAGRLAQVVAVRDVVTRQERRG